MPTPSVPDEEERWRRKQAHYQDPEVVASYDAQRFGGRHSRRATARKWRAIVRSLGEELGRVETVLDVPCGTGRFTGFLLGAGKRVVQADRSHPMLLAARSKAAPATTPAVQCDAQRLPFVDRSFDLVLSVRFLFHVPRPLRPVILREMARVSRRWVVVDVRHRYSIATWTKRLRAHLGSRSRVSARASLSEIRADLDAAGLRLEKRAWLSPPFSEKLLLFCLRA